MIVIGNIIRNWIVRVDCRVLLLLTTIVVCVHEQGDGTALMRAVRGRHLECVSTLLTHGADVDMTNEVSE